MEKSFSRLNENCELLLRDAQNMFLEMKISSSGNFNIRDFDSLAILREVRDAVKLLSLRARQVNALYRSQTMSITSVPKDALLSRGREAINLAAEVVSRRELAYQVPWQRIASWRENPTVYRYGYLWSVHSLYYWWRDQGLAEKPGPRPCFLNRMDASEVAVGWGKYSLELARNILDRYLPFSSTFAVNFMNCFVPPPREYKFPDALNEVVLIDEEEF